MTATARPRDLALTFAGGGNRAFYQLGIMRDWGERLWPRTAVVSSCSAGACVAAVILSGREAQTRAFWGHRRAHVTKNLDWTKLARLQRPAPHAEVYRDTMLCVAADGGLERIQSQPFPVLVLCAQFPRVVPAAMSAALGFGAYNLDKRMRPDAVHQELSRRMFRPFVFDMRDCRTPAELADLVLASSATPPFTPVGRFRGRRLLDGGLIDNAPADLGEERPGVLKSIVLLTRPGPDARPSARRLYVAPSRSVPIQRWDYTRPDLLDATVEMGVREADLHRPTLARYLAR